MRQTIYALAAAAALTATPALAGDDCRNKPLSCDLQSAMGDAAYMGSSSWHHNEQDIACVSARAQELILKVTSNVSSEIRGIQSRIENTGWEVFPKTVEQHRSYVRVNTERLAREVGSLVSMGFLLGDGHGAKTCERTGRTALPVARELKEGFLALGKDFDQYLRHREMRQERDAQRQYQEELLQRTHDADAAQRSIDVLTSDLRDARGDLRQCTTDRGRLERELATCSADYAACAADLDASSADTDALTKGFVAAYEFALKTRAACIDSFRKLKYSVDGAGKKCDAGTVPDDATTYLAAQANRLRALPVRTVEQEALLLRIDALFP